MFNLEQSLNPEAEPSWFAEARTGSSRSPIRRFGWGRLREALWIAALVSGWSCTSAPPPSEPTPAAPSNELRTSLDLDPEAINLAGIEFVEAVKAGLPETLEVAGRIGVNENRTARVGALAAGRITNVLANVGDRVREGQTLAQIQSYEVDDTRSQYAKARAELDRANSQLEFSQKVRDRAARLYELKAGSLEELQRAEAELHRAQTEIVVIRAEMGRLEEKLEQLGLSIEGAFEEYAKPGGAQSEHYGSLERVPVVSPLTGTVLQRLVTPGTVVSSSDDAFIVSDLSTLWVQAEVSEAYLASLREGQQVQVKVEAYPSTLFPARLAHVGDVLNPATRTVQVRCEAPNPQRRLRSEMYATVLFDLGTGEETILLPRASVQNVDNRDLVFVRKGDSSFEVRSVKLGRSTETQVSILEGIHAGEQVVTAGSFLLKSELLKARMQEE
ncbi:MAG: efflux RND transporter periplasmic adaptor subunit [Acidobacteriota bacterium]